MSSTAQTKAEQVTIVGAGLAGSLLGILLARRGHRVRIYERLGDLRRVDVPAGRSINLALAARGIRALEIAGVMDEVRPLLIPMPGRMLHDVQGALTFVPYGQGSHEVIYSVSRPGLNRILLDAAERSGVEVIFGHPAASADFARRHITLRNETTGRPEEIAMHCILGADGAGSVLRRAMVSELQVECTEDLLEHGYKELTLPPQPDGMHRIDKHALHIWPRGGFMLIALPNLDGSFTVTLFLPLTGKSHASCRSGRKGLGRFRPSNQPGADSFATLTTAEAIDAFFARHFPDAQRLMPQLASEFLRHPTGIMGTVRCRQWSVSDQLLLIGDAAHAITPFHGQGMNCAFEDCRELDALLARHTDWSTACSEFEGTRRPNTDAIATMAIENYLEMRDTVRDPKFLLHRSLSLELERRFPQRFIPRYSMVMFRHDIPYSLALDRGRIQQEILSQLTTTADSLDSIDYTAARQLIEQRLPPIPA